MTTTRIGRYVGGLYTWSLLLFLPGCSGCQGDKAPLSFVPQDSALVVVVPRIDAPLMGLKGLMDKFRNQGTVQMALDQVKKQLVAELGFDPENPETLKKKGIDPAGGLTISLASDGESTNIAVAISDEEAMEKFLRETATRIEGGSLQFLEKAYEGQKVTLAVGAAGYKGATDDPAGAVPLIGWTYVGKHVLLCPQAKGGAVGRYLAQVAKQKTSIKNNETFTDLRDQVGKHQLLFYVDGAASQRMVASKAAEELKTASEQMKKMIQEMLDTQKAIFGYFKGLSLGVHVSGKGLNMRSVLAMPPEKGKTIAAIFKGAGDSPDFGKFISADALAVARFSLNLKRLMDAVLEVVPADTKRQIFSSVEQTEREMKLSMEKDVLGVLAGRYAVALFAPDLSALKGFSLMNPAALAGVVQLVAMAQVSKPDRAADLLRTLERFMVMARMDVKTRSEGEHKLYTIEAGGQPVVTWTLAKELLIIGTGDRVRKTLGLIKDGGDSLLSEMKNPRAKKLIKSEDGMVMYYSMAKTLEAVRRASLPTELKLIISTAMSSLEKIADFVFYVEAEDQGIKAEFSASIN